MAKRKPVSSTPSDAEILNGLIDYFLKKGSMKSIAKELNIEFGQFRNKLRDAYEQNYILINPPENKNKIEKLNSTWPKVKHHVLNASGDHFFRYTQGVFFKELGDLLNERDMHSSKKPLCIGVVSGRTSGGMIESICNMNDTWGSYIRLDLLPKEINIYALNVSQTDGYDQLRGNANILTYQLAHRFQAEVAQSKVEAFGLSAALLQSKKERQKTDCSKVMSELLKKTDPNRLASSLKAQKQDTPSDLPEESQLDMIITGVGSLADSFFVGYCRANEFELDQFHMHHIAGDIAYNPVDNIGEPKHLLNKKGETCEFYCAVSLEVLREMSYSSSKRVIVVARNSKTSKKIDIIHAAIYGDHPLCDVLITDDETAEGLFAKFC